MKTNTDKETVTIQIASVMDDCGTGKILTATITKQEEKEYNDGMAKMAEWG